jgi:hypothetical protein
MVSLKGLLYTILILVILFKNYPLLLQRKSLREILPPLPKSIKKENTRILNVKNHFKVKCVKNHGELCRMGTRSISDSREKR